MDDLDRPNLSLDVLEQIEVDLHQQDMRFWPRMKSLQLPTPESQKAYAPFVFNEGPLPPKRPQQLSKLLAEYATATFQAEASKYDRINPRFAKWLQALAGRMEERTMERVEQVEAGNPTNSLAYHGLSFDAMRVAVRQALREAMSAWPQTADQTGATVPSDTPTMVAPVKHQRGTHSRSAVRRLDAFLEAKQIGLTNFACSAGTTDKTLRKFRETGTVRDGIFDDIAKAMGITRDELLKP